MNIYRALDSVSFFLLPLIGAGIGSFFGIIELVQALDSLPLCTGLLP